jgi:GNAT superfamily N-acetyltransferase
MELSLVMRIPEIRRMESPAPELEIRLATPHDAPEAFALAEEYFAAIGVVAREDQQQFEREYFGVGRGFWLARWNNQLAGCAALRKFSIKTDPTQPLVECAEIKRMYVREAFRGKGIAQSLLTEAETFARNSGYAWIYLDTTDQMKAAARLYERNGFVHCERYNDNPQATIFMRKRPAPGA